MYGENGSGIHSFFNEHKRTHTKFNNIQNQIIQLLEETIIPKELQPYFYQQQYISLFSNLEYFLYNTFMWETCQCYDSYKRVIDAHYRFLEREENVKEILHGEHCILQEKTFIEQIKYIVYHNTSQVRKIYKTAFNIDVDLDILEDERDIRNDIAHRVGYTKDHVQLQITKDNVLNLKEKISNLVNSITEQIKIFNRQNNILE